MASLFYYGSRLFLRKKRWLLRFAQAVRSWWILGPLRPYAVRYYQRRPHNRRLRVVKRDIFPELQVDQVIDALNKNGYAVGVKIPAEYVTRIVQYCENTRLIRDWNPHKQCCAIDEITRNAKIVEIARRYLGAEPILWLSQLQWTLGDAATKRNLIPSRHIEPLLYDKNAFHYDALDFKSLTLFVYLTDVNITSGPHVVIQGTHANKSFVDMWLCTISDSIAHQRFGSRVKVILGQKGTMLFEETSSYHKASECQTERLMLSIDYTLRRPPPPERPVVGTTPLSEHDTN